MLPRSGDHMTRIRLELAAIVYALLCAAAVLVAVFRNNIDLFCHPHPAYSLGLVARLLIGLATGIVLGFLVSRVTIHSVKRYAWARLLHVEFRAILGKLSTRDALVYALSSSVGEELFFRGALQPLLGLTATSLVFGLLHIGPGRRFIPWTFQAIAMGFVFGWLFETLGDLTAPLVAHFTINYLNLQFVSHYDPAVEPEKT